MASWPASSLLVLDIISLLLVKMNILTFLFIFFPQFSLPCAPSGLLWESFRTNCPSLGDAGFLTLLPWLTWIRLAGPRFVFHFSSYWWDKESANRRKMWDASRASLESESDTWRTHFHSIFQLAWCLLPPLLLGWIFLSLTHATSPSPGNSPLGSTVMALQETTAHVSFPQIFFHVHQFQEALE